MIFFYNIFIALYSLGMRLAALWHPKAKQWRQGRQHLFKTLEQTFSKPHATIWVHSASAGEFEQAKPVIEALKKKYPQHKILATFFSPSGYGVGKKNNLADYVFYLPLDTQKNATRFVNTVQPALVIFVKYDFWYHHLKAVKDRQIPLLLVSAIFRKNQTFFKPYGGFYLKMLHLFTHLFVQDQPSYGLLKKFGVNHCTVAGDTRFDRVTTIAKNAGGIEGIEQFIGESKQVFIAGSTWPDDEKMLYGFFKNLPGVKLVIAPHEINEPHIKSIVQLFKNPILYSALKKGAPVTNETVLIIDNIGMLSRLYQYATITYIGGGFNKSGIHNTLEAAVWGRPVIFGPTYHKFREAKELMAAGGAFSYSTDAELAHIINTLLTNAAATEHAGKAAARYVQQNRGATEKIMDYIQENRLLTS